MDPDRDRVSLGRHRQQGAVHRVWAQVEGVPSRPSAGGGLLVALATDARLLRADEVSPGVLQAASGGAPTGDVGAQHAEGPWVGGLSHPAPPS
eukprot:9979924-Lingulodinium_polyedra.AAC.1